METRLDDLVCKICNKKYKNRSGIWKHNMKHHPPNILRNPPNILRNPPNLEDVSTIQSFNKLTCEYCKKEFSRIDNLKRHINLRCITQKNILLEDPIKTQSHEITEIKTLLKELMNKNCKVHPKTLLKINKQLNTINNIENNITYNIIGLGHENLSNTFDKNEKMNILKYKYLSLPQLIEYTHFNDKYPQFKNILITNNQNTLAYKYDNNKKQFIAVNKNDLLEDIVDVRMCDINSFYEELEDELDNKTKEILDKFKHKIDNDPEYRELKKKDIKLIIYNNKEEVNKDFDI